MSVQIELIYLILGLVVIVAIFYVVFRARKHHEEAPEGRLGIEDERNNVGDVLTGTPATKKDIVDAISGDEPDVPTLARAEASLEVPRSTTYTLPETTIAVPETPPEVFVDVPKVALRRPELAQEIKPLASSSGRHRSNVDPLLETCVLFTPKDGCFTAEKLTRIGELIEAAALPVSLYCDFFDAHVGSWTEDCDSTVGCTAVFVSMQLAHRGKLADEVLLSEFLQLGNQIAIAIDAEVELPDVVNTLAQVQKLGQLIEQFDNTLALTIRCETSIDMDRLQEIVDANGFKETEGKTFEKCQKGCKTPYFKLKVLGEAEESLSLEYDIPLCDSTLAPLSSFFALANDLSCALNGVLVDASGNPVGAAAAGFIDAELRKLAVAMSHQGVAPGSQRAMRLFSR